MGEASLSNMELDQAYEAKMRACKKLPDLDNRTSDSPQPRFEQMHKLVTYLTYVSSRESCHGYTVYYTAHIEAWPSICTRRSRRGTLSAHHQKHGKFKTGPPCKSMMDHYCFDRLSAVIMVRLQMWLANLALIRCLNLLLLGPESRMTCHQIQLQFVQPLQCSTLRIRPMKATALDSEMHEVNWMTRHVTPRIASSHNQPSHMPCFTSP